MRRNERVHLMTARERYIVQRAYTDQVLVLLQAIADLANLGLEEYVTVRKEFDRFNTYLAHILRTEPEDRHGG